MALSFWSQTSGTWFNVLTVLLGSGLGLRLQQQLSKPLQQVMTQAIGLITLLLGLRMASQLFTLQNSPVDGVLLGLILMVLGGLLGTQFTLEDRLESFGNWLKQRFQGQGQFSEGFVAASLLFCVGPMTLIGSLENGLLGNSAVLNLKATMDGVASIVLAGSYGWGVAFATLPILIYQGGVSLLAGTLTNLLPDPAQDASIQLMTGCGGLMVLGIGLNLLEVTRLPIAAFLPTLLLAPLVYRGLSWLF
jgi:uncharacterized membrane protein YqgA involved in biofilm formation